MVVETDTLKSLVEEPGMYRRSAGPSERTVRPSEGSTSR
jgi:hypothetical protein